MKSSETHSQLTAEYHLPMIDEYELARYINCGRWSNVFEATRKTDGKKVALKFLSLDDLARKQMEERHLSIDEYFAKASLGSYSNSHSNIAWNYVDAAPDGTKFLVEEYIPVFLPDFISGRESEGKPLTIDEISKIAKGLASAIDVMHSRINRVHSDLHINNIGYLPDEATVKVSDFGTSTFGLHENDNVGYMYTRAPERYGMAEGTKKSDVWSFGSLLYRIFTGKYVLEDELKYCSAPESFMGELYSDKRRYRGLINTKLDDPKIPKAYRKLLQRCLASEEDRIEDGGDLVAALEVADKKYHRSMPLQRLKRYSLATAAAVLITAAGIGGYGALQADTIRHELSKANESRQYEKELRLIKLHQQRSDGRSNDSYFDFTDKGRLDAVLSRFKDKMTAYAFFINPDSTAKAIKMAGGRTDYDSVKKQIWTFDTELGCNLLDVEGNSTDSIAVRISGDNYSDMTKKINALEKKYGVRLNDHPDGY